jgi:hypothetical protein
MPPLHYNTPLTELSPNDCCTRTLRDVFIPHVEICVLNLVPHLHETEDSYEAGSMAGFNISVIHTIVIADWRQGHAVEQWYSTGGTRRHPKILFFCHLKFII